MREPKKVNEFIYFALRNKKLLIGFSIILIFLFLGLIGPLLMNPSHTQIHLAPNHHPPNIGLELHFLGRMFFHSL